MVSGRRWGGVNSETWRLADQRTEPSRRGRCTPLPLQEDKGSGAEGCNIIDYLPEAIVHGGGDGDDEYDGGGGVGSCTVK